MPPKAHTPTLMPVISSQVKTPEIMCSCTDLSDHAAKAVAGTLQLARKFAISSWFLQFMDLYDLVLSSFLLPPVTQELDSLLHP